MDITLPKEATSDGDGSTNVERVDFIELLATSQAKVAGVGDFLLSRFEDAICAHGASGC
jgi:hypothetical protein